MTGNRGRRAGDASRGQVLVVFAMSMTLFLGLCALVIDVAWYWSNSLRVQRAADAAALAGVVYLPGDEVSAIAAARAEAVKNGYTNGVGGTVVTAGKDAANPRSLRVTVSASVPTYFMHFFGTNALAAQRSSQAEYVLPVPMGSPENYYGVFGKLRTPLTYTPVTTTTPVVTTLLLPTTSPSGNWLNPTWAQSATDADASATQSSTTNPYQAWSGFNIPAPGAGTFTLDGIELQVRAASTDPTGCALRASLSWNGASVTTGASWTATTHDVVLTDLNQALYTVGGSTDTWGRTWTAAELTNANFRVRLQYLVPSVACATGYTASVDAIWVRLSWHLSVTVNVPDANLTGPNNEILTPRGFWGAMLSQGAETINGDAYLPYYQTRTGSLSTDYKPNDYYDYAVEMPAGSANGQVQVFDPGFCATAVSGEYGTGDRWFAGTNPVSAFYLLYDTQNTLYDKSDDVLVASSGDLFKQQQASDTVLQGPTGSGVVSCSPGATAVQTDGRYWHNRWWTLANNLDGGTDGKVYRVHTQSTDPNVALDQVNANAQNNFALWATASGGTPSIYGLGAMEMFSPLDPSTASTFYLAQIEAVHAGKTVVISLWDPGDTADLPATLQILLPTTTGYTPGTFSWTAKKGTTNANADSCNTLTGTNVTSVVVNAGGSGGSGQKFNGCWVTITVRIPAAYAAPTPPGETGAGWWKIKYTMGAGTNSSSDVTTWQVQIRGNPVHLVLP